MQVGFCQGHRAGQEALVDRQRRLEHHPRRAFVAAGLELDDQHGQFGVHVAAHTQAPALGAQGRAPLGVPQRQPRVRGGGEGARGVHLEAADGQPGAGQDRFFSLAVVGDVAAPELEGEDARLRCEYHCAEETVAEKGAFLPAGGHAAPEQILAGEEGGPVDLHDGVAGAGGWGEQERQAQQERQTQQERQAQQRQGRAEAARRRGGRTRARHAGMLLDADCRAAPRSPSPAVCRGGGRGGGRRRGSWGTALTRRRRRADLSPRTGRGEEK